MRALGICCLLTAVCSWHAVCAGAADEALRVSLPRSDLTRGGLPYVIRVVLPPDAANASCAVRLTRHPSEADAVQPVEAALTLARGGDGTAAVVIDPAPLAEGEYAGEMTVKAGEREVRQTFSLFRMPEGKPSRGIRYGVYAVPFRGDAKAVQATVDMLHRHGVDLIQTHINDIWRVSPPYDRAARLGIEFMPSITTLGSGIKPSDEYHIFFADGDKPKWPWACFKNPDGRANAAEKFAEALRGFKQHAGFSNLVYYGDDLVIPVKRKDGKMILGCYCRYCREGFKALTGSDPPLETAPLSGVVPADNLYLRWMHYRVEDVYGGFVQAMRQAKDSAAPDVRFGLIHGWSGQPFINLSRASYSPVTHRSADAVSSYTYPNLRYPRLDFIGHYEMARMNNRDKDVWMLGILGMNRTLMHDFVINQNYWLMLAAGYKMIGYFGWNEVVRALEPQERVVPHLQQTLEAHVRIGQHKNWLFPAAAHWRQEPARHAVLFSFTTEAADVMPEDRGFEHLTSLLSLHREAVRRRLPMHFVSEEEVRDGILSHYDALCLHAVKALPADVHKAITDYAAGGGRVYVSASTVRIEGGLNCAMETAVALCREDVTPPVEILDPDVVVRDFYAGDLRYHVLVNNMADRFHGLPFDYQKPEANEALGRMVRAHQRAVSGTALFRDKGRWLFDMSTGAALGKTDQTYAFALEPSWGQAIASLPVPSATLKVTGPAAAVQGETVVWRARFEGPDGRPVNGAFTVRVRITNPAGRESRYSGYFSAGAGTLDIPLRLGANDQTGTWTLHAEGGFPRIVVPATLEVRAGKGMPECVTAR